MLQAKIRKSDSINLEDEAISFEYGNPSVEILEGTVRLFKNTSKRQRSNYSTWLSLLSLPSYLRLTDFFSFLGNQFHEISKIIIVRKRTTSKYMVFLSFPTKEKTEEFYKIFQNKPYPNDLSSSFFSNLSSSLNSSKQTCIFSLCFITSIEFQSFKPTSNLTNSTLIEVPSCPVCLEKLDISSTPIIQTVCNHSFHTTCLSKWQREDSSCPVCRFSNINLFGASSDDLDEDSKTSCEVCEDSSFTDLWICMLCAHVGCGRYNKAHAKEHFVQTGHAYALDLYSQRCWNYVEDAYVHRLIRNKVDGKIVELPDPDAGRNLSARNEFFHTRKSRVRSSSWSHFEGFYQERKDDEKRDATSLTRDEFGNKILDLQYEENCRMKAVYESKLEKMTEEYSKLLVSQLDSQKQYFEKKEKKLNKVQEDVVFLRSLNKQLISDQKNAREIIQGLKKENEQMKKKLNGFVKQQEKVQDLEEQVADLMLHIDSMNKIRHKPGKKNAKGGKLVIRKHALRCSGSDSMEYRNLYQVVDRNNLWESNIRASNFILDYHNNPFVLVLWQNNFLKLCYNSETEN
eukprot:snap_masked-scaffold_2-processed-gene-11.14-mRNA-1 protein AED:0.40 eAED:0.44 QI:0/0/0/0.25/1/1/4/0/569